MSTNKYELSRAKASKIESICVFCWGRLGDVFIRSPIINALNKKFPNASITVVTDTEAARAFNPHTTKYNIFPFKRFSKGKINSFLQIIRNIRDLRKHKFDLSIDLYGGGSSPLISYLVASKIRLAFDHRPKLRISNNLLAPYPHGISHWSQSIGSMLTPLGIDHQQISTDVIYDCDNNSRAHVKPLLHVSDTHYVGVNLGAGTLDKAWPVQNIIELLTALSDRINITPVIFFNPGQEDVSEQFLSLYPHQCVSLKGLNFEQEAAALEHCDILITGDTALMHLATGVKTPAFAIFLETRPEPVQPRQNPFHACLIEDYEKELVYGAYQVKNKIPVSVALNEFIHFTESKLDWIYN
jgi:ADP-heptose:LPS heptosyltransferase